MVFLFSSLFGQVSPAASVSDSTGLPSPSEVFEPEVFSGKELLKYNFNPGVSFGIGGGRLQYGIPNVSLKMGNWTLSGMLGGNNGYYGRNYSFQVDLELPYSVSKKKEVYLAATLAGRAIGSELSSLNKVYFDESLGSILVGVHIPQANNRSRIAIRAGFASLWSFQINANSSGWYYGYQRFNERSHNQPYGEISYQLYALPFGKKQKVLRKIAMGEMRVDSEKVKSTLATWFNPYWSVGLGLDRAIWTPALGIKMGPVNGKVSFWDDLTAWGMFAANGNIDLVRVSNSDKHENWLGIGANYFNSSSDDGLGGSSTDFSGLSLNFNRYNFGKRTSIELKAGVGRATSSSHQWDWDKEESIGTSSTSYVPNFGASFDIYLFKLQK